MEGMQNCLNNKVFTGVCTSLCQTNIDDLLTEKWVDRLIEMGVMYTWFHVYRPMGPDANPELCLTPEQQLQARQFVVEMRAKKPIVIVDAYYDGEGQALCPAATGISHHINPWGDIEPCPIVQFTQGIDPRDEADTRSLRDKFLQSAFLRDFRELAQYDDARLHRAGTARPAARSWSRSTARRTRRSAARRWPSWRRCRCARRNTIPGSEVPEKNWLYRLAKRYWFNDFGVYAGKKASVEA